MTPENFCYWLQGYFEINAAYLAQGLDAAQTEMIREHLQLVFDKQTTPLKIDIDGRKVLQDLGMDFQLEQKKIMDEKIRMNCYTPNQSSSATNKDGFTTTTCHNSPFSCEELPKVEVDKYPVPPSNFYPVRS